MINQKATDNTELKAMRILHETARSMTSNFSNASFKIECTEGGAEIHYAVGSENMPVPEKVGKEIAESVFFELFNFLVSAQSSAVKISQKKEGEGFFDYKEQRFYFRALSVPTPSGFILSVDVTKKPKVNLPSLNDLRDQIIFESSKTWMNEFDERWLMQEGMSVEIIFTLDRGVVSVNLVAAPVLAGISKVYIPLVDFSPDRAAFETLRAAYSQSEKA